MAWIEKRGNLHVGYYRDGAGNKHRAGSSKSKREAKQLAEDQEAKLRSGEWRDPKQGKRALGDYFENDWLPNRRMERTTRLTYMSHWNSTLKTAWAATPVADITPSGIQRWVNTMDSEGMKASTVIAKYKALATILGAQKGVSAVRDRLIKETPCEGIQLPEVDEAEDPEIYEVDEVAALVEAMGPWWAPVPLLASDTSYRWGELMGLTVNAFYDEFTMIHLTRTVTETTIEDTGNGTPFAWKDRPKGRRARRTAIPPEASAAMEQLIKDRQLFGNDRLFSMPTRRRQHGGGDPGSTIRRTEQWPEGLPIGRSFFREQIWLPAHVKTGIEPRKFHSLRGTHLTWLLAGGADLRTVQERADHKSIRTTQVYLGLMAGKDRRALDALAITKRRASGD